MAIIRRTINYSKKKPNPGWKAWKERKLPSLGQLT